MSLTRRRLFAILAGLGMLPEVLRAQAAEALPVARALDAELAQALARGQPLVVMVSLVGCPWCRLVREHYLLPMRRESKLAVVEVDIRGTQPLRDLSGVQRTQAEVVRAWGVKGAPTLLFFGRGGREVAPRLEGYSNDFYGAYLDDRLQQARKGVEA